MLLLDINPDQTAYGGEGPQELTDHGGTLFFTSYDADFNRDLWRTDGTTATTIKVADLDDLSTSGLSSVGSNLFFAAETAADGLELYVYNGSMTSLIDVNPGYRLIEPSRNHGVWRTSVFQCRWWVRVTNSIQQQRDNLCAGGLRASLARPS